MSKKRKIALWSCVGAAVVLVVVLALALMLTDGKKTHTQHEFTEVQVLRQASCSADGIIAHRCSCGKEQLEITLAKGHVLNGWSVEKTATCAAEGVEIAQCSRCGEKQTRQLPKVSHSYAPTTEEKAPRLTFVCAGCDDRFEVDGALEIDLRNARHFRDCGEDYQFRVYCEQGEAYIREHLIIADTYYYNTDKQVNLPYDIQGGYGSYWTIVPQNPYIPGNVYVAARSGGVLFEDLTVRNMTFQIRRAESNEVELSRDVKFLQSLQEARPGYYPYTLEYSQGGGTYWLTLQSVKGLAVGDIICVGDAKSLEDVKAQTGEPDVFGQINMIRYDETTKAYKLELGAPDLTKLFSVLNIYSTDMTLIEDIQLASDEELTRQAAQMMYQSEDFGKMLCSVQQTTAEYLSVRGYTTNLTSLKDFLGSIKIEKDESSEEPYITLSPEGLLNGKVVIKGELPIDINLPSGETVGELKFYFKTTVSLDSMQLVLNLEKQEVDIDGQEQVIKAQIGSEQQITVGLTLGAEVSMEWALGDEPYVLYEKTGKYHYKDCRHLSAVKNQSDLKPLSAESLFEKMGDGSIRKEDECKTCLPVSSMEADSYVINTESKEIHTQLCAKVKGKLSENFKVTEKPYNNLTKEGYNPCGDCNPVPMKTSSYAAQVLQNMKRQDMGNSMKEYKKLAEKIGNSDEANMLPLGKVYLSITGLDNTIIDFNLYFSFSLEASLEYNYEQQINSWFGIYVTDSGFMPYADSTQRDIRNDLTLSGKARADAGFDAGIKITLTGLEKFCYADLSAQIGFYAQLQGAVQYDFMTKTLGYAAAYFEAGLHVDLVGTIKLAKWSMSTSFIPEDWQDLPFLQYGYGKVYFNFLDTPEEIIVDTIYYDLERANLLEVKYYDIIDMEQGIDKLSINGIRDKYDVEYRLKNGTHCTVADGFLLVTEPNEAFTDELTVVVTGYDTWGKYRHGNTQYNMQSATVVLRYDPLGNQAQIPQEAETYDGHRYQLYSLPAQTTVEQAMAHCESLGGYPCTITTPEESAFVEQYLISKGGKSQIYFGLVYDADKEAWKWRNAEEMDYADWGTATPGTGSAVLSLSGMEYAWMPGSQTPEAEVLILCEWGAYTTKEDMTAEEHMDALVGYYQGWYTATQGITGGSIGVHRTNALLQDEAALQMYADRATDCARTGGGGLTTQFTVEDIRKIIDGHDGEYIAIYMFGPLRQNPNVEDGLYTMSVSYDEKEGVYKLVGEEWIQRDTYVFVDIKPTVLQGDNLFGDVYQSYSKTGELSMTRYIPSFES